MEAVEYGNISPGTNNIGYSSLSVVRIDWLPYQDNFWSSQIIFDMFFSLISLVNIFLPLLFSHVYHTALCTIKVWILCNTVPA